MTLEDIKARAAAIEAELRALDEVPDWTEEQRASWQSLHDELGQLEETRDRLVERGVVLERSQRLANIEAPQVMKRAGDPYDLDTIRSVDFLTGQGELRSRAITAVERTEGLEDEARAQVIDKLERVKDPRGLIPGYVLFTGNPAYREAFHKGMAGAQALWTDAERQAVMAAQSFRAAMSLTDANGGYGVPFTLDPSLVLTNDGSTNPFRQVCRVESIATDTWNGLTSAGVTASFDGEIVEVSDDSPTFAQPTATPKRAQAFVQGSIEIAADYRNLTSDLQMLFADAKDNLEASIFSVLTSYGVVPLVTAYDSGSSLKASAATDTFAVADVYATQNQTPPKARSKAVWFANNGIINLIRQFATANNYHAYLTDLGAGQPSILLGNPLYEASGMDGTITGSADNYVLLHGDPKGYLIADRIGTLAIEFIPHLFNTSNNLPDGRRGWFAYWRVGTALINGNGFTLLNVT